MSTSKSGSFYWNPQKVSNCSLKKYVLVILNRKIEFEKEFMISLWNRAYLKIVVDGGANRWFDFLEGNNLSNSEKRNLPDFITGDLDSISQLVLKKFESLGTKVINTPNQDETDFTKALRFLAECHSDELCQVEAVITLAETCGRFDQIMANINTLYKAREILGMPVYLLSSDSITWILWTGEHEIEVKRCEEDSDKKWCSLIPVGKRCRSVTTSGLKWNLDSQALEFGDLVSTSNTYSPGHSVVRVKCSDPLVWSMQWL